MLDGEPDRRIAVAHQVVREDVIGGGVGGRSFPDGKPAAAAFEEEVAHEHSTLRLPARDPAPVAVRGVEVGPRVAHGILDVETGRFVVRAGVA